jgi:hypothetical protein
LVHPALNKLQKSAIPAQRIILPEREEAGAGQSFLSFIQDEEKLNF